MNILFYCRFSTAWQLLSYTLESPWAVGTMWQSSNETRIGWSLMTT